MKAIRLHAFGGPETLVYEDGTKPQPKEGEVLVRVHATAIAPREFAWEPTWRTRSSEPRQFPIILGHEFSGVIAAPGPGVTDFKAGDAVYGINDWFGDGAQAEYCLAKPEELAFKTQIAQSRTGSDGPYFRSNSLAGAV